MAPFVPDIISDQLNLVVALFIGMGFGFVLEQAGFSSSRKLAGVFYGYDFTVLRVFFTAAITAMSGTLLLGALGWLDLEAIYINPTWLWPAVIGGAIMGVGFVVGGYCPGTSICAMAIGKLDAAIFVGGGLAGVFLFGEFYPLYQQFYDSSAMGAIKVFDSLGISSGLFALILIVVAVGAFAITTLIERKSNPSAPSFGFKRLPHRVAGIGVIVVALILLVLPDRKARLVSMASEPAYMALHPVKVMSADELAFMIMDQEPNLQIIDIRSAGSYTELALPGARNIQLNELFNKEWGGLFSLRHVKRVLVADTESEETSACLIVQKLGYENCAILQGGFSVFKNSILDPTPFVPTGSRWDGDVREFRETARIEINKMILDGKNTTPKETRTEKKIKGGC